MQKAVLIQFFVNSGPVDHEQAVSIAERFNERTLRRNEFFLEAGKLPDEYMFLHHGFMRSYAIDTEGNEVTTAFYSAKNVVFEVSSFFNRTRSKENIQALTDCEGWFITYAELNDLFHSLPAFRDFGRSILVKGFSGLKTRMLSMITETAEERYQHLMNTQPEIFQYAPLKHIASYLGITDTSLSRIRKELAGK